jgi:hypothetical protein
VRSRGLQPHQWVAVATLYLTGAFLMLAGGSDWFAFGLVMYASGLVIGRGVWS